MKQIIKSLVKIANDLDADGDTAQADKIDKVMHKLADMGFVLEEATAPQLDSITRPLKAIHYRFKNYSPFKDADFKGQSDAVDIVGMLGRIGISPPYGSINSLLQKIETFKNSGGVGSKNIRTEDIRTQVGSPGYEGSTSTEDYTSAIKGRQVKVNPRYTPRDLTGDGKPETFCNIYVSDVMRSMGIPLPHVIDKNGNPVPSGTRGSKELLANDTAVWLSQHGSRFEWEKVTESVAQEAANAGHAAIVIIPGGKHIAVIYPGQITDKGASIAQAGKSLLENAHVVDGFGKALYKSGRLEYWVNKSKDLKLLPSIV